MATKAQWEVDPETRSKVRFTPLAHGFRRSVEYLFEGGWLTIYGARAVGADTEKEGAGNDKCCDCGAPSPQWVRLSAPPSPPFQSHHFLHAQDL